MCKIYIKCETKDGLSSLESLSVLAKSYKKNRGPRFPILIEAELFEDKKLSLSKTIDMADERCLDAPVVGLGILTAILKS